MSHRRLAVAIATYLLLTVTGLPLHAQQWLPPIQKVPHVFVQTEVLGVRGGKTHSLGKGTIEASPGRPGTLTIPLDLGPASADHPTSIQIEVTQNAAGDPKIGLTIATTVEVTSRAGEVTRVRRERIAEVDEGRSFFHQAYENAAQGTSVLLTLTPDTRIVPQLVKPTLSAPIVFNVSLSHVTKAGDVALEDNVLRTLENSPVTYAFRIATARSKPVEAIADADASVEGAASPLPGSEAAPSAQGPTETSSQSSAEGAKSAGDDKAKSDAKAKKTKPKKLSRKEREQEALAQFQRSREAQQVAAAAGSSAEEPPSPGSASDGEAAPAPASAEPAPPAKSVPSADELELTLLPHRVESGILMVEASLRGRAPGAGGAERATLVQRMQAVTSNGSFDITVSGLGPAGEGSYRFSIQARF